MLEGITNENDIDKIHTVCYMYKEGYTNIAYLRGWSFVVGKDKKIQELKHILVCIILILYIICNKMEIL